MSMLRQCAFIFCRDITLLNICHLFFLSLPLPLLPKKFIWNLTMVSFYCLYFYKITSPKFWGGMIENNSSNFTELFCLFFFFYDNLFFDVFCLTSPLLSGLFLSFIFIALFSFSLFFSYNKMLKNWYIKLINHNHMDHHVNYLISQQSCKIGIIVIPIIQMGNWDTECLSNLPKSTKK